MPWFRGVRAFRAAPTSTCVSLSDATFMPSCSSPRQLHGPSVPSEGQHPTPQSVHSPSVVCTHENRPIDIEQVSSYDELHDQRRGIRRRRRLYYIMTSGSCASV